MRVKSSIAWLATLDKPGEKRRRRAQVDLLSRSRLLDRLQGMNLPDLSTRTSVGVVVIAHLIISLVHGTAHAEARIPMSTAANLFVILVILAGPLLGLSMLWRFERPGSGIIAATLLASLLFGVVNHFVLANPDHVAHVAAQVRPLFATTAVLLALTESLGAALAVRLSRGTAQLS